MALLTLGNNSSLTRVPVSLTKVLDKDRRPDEFLGMLGTAVVGVAKHMASSTIMVNSISSEE